MSAFTKKSTPAESRPKAPTSYQFFKDATSGQKKSTPSVEAIFEPSGDIKSYGFMCSMMRFNIYQDDERYEECADLVAKVTSEGLMLRIIYDQSERGLATLKIDSKKRCTWIQKGNRWYIPQQP